MARLVWRGDGGSGDRAGEGIGLLVDPERVEAAAALAVETARAAGLAAATDHRDGAWLIALFTIHPDAGERRWLLIEARTSLTLEDGSLATVRDAATETREFNGYSLAALRGPKAVNRPWISEHARAPRDGAVVPSLPSRLWTVPYNAPAFFAIIGPDGVGKSTTCEHVTDIFNGYPIRFRQFHHVLAWKRSIDSRAHAKASTVGAGEGDAGRKRGAAYRAARGLWRNLVPAFVKQQILPVPAEIQYIDQVTRILSEAHFANQMVLSDRYCYDRYVRWQIMTKPSSLRFVTTLECMVLRRPTCAFLLQDDPATIYSRKPAMPVREIENHQPMLAEACRRFDVPHEIIDLGGQHAVDIACRIAKRMLEITGPNVFDLIETAPSSG